MKQAFLSKSLLFTPLLDKNARTDKNKKGAARVELHLFFVCLADVTAGTAA